MAESSLKNSRNLHEEIETMTEVGMTDEEIRLDNKESREDDLERMKRNQWDFHQRLKAIEENLLAKVAPQTSMDHSKFITKQEMVVMIRSAISQGSAEFGVSRKFIRKVLNDQFDVPLSSYYTKKMSSVLQAATKEGKIVFDCAHQLYKLV